MGYERVDLRSYFELQSLSAFLYLIQNYSRKEFAQIMNVVITERESSIKPGDFGEVRLVMVSVGCCLTTHFDLLF